MNIKKLRITIGKPINSKSIIVLFIVLLLIVSHAFWVDYYYGAKQDQNMKLVLQLMSAGNPLGVPKDWYEPCVGVIGCARLTGACGISMSVKREYSKALALYEEWFEDNYTIECM